MLDSVIELMQDVVSVLAGNSLHHWALCCVYSKRQGLGKKHIFFWQQLLLPVAVGIGSTRHRENSERDMHEHDDR